MTLVPRTKLPEPNNIIWTFHRGEFNSRHGLIWAVGKKVLLRIKPDLYFVNNLNEDQTKGMKQIILQQFWRKLGGA